MIETIALAILYGAAALLVAVVAALAVCQALRHPMIEAEREARRYEAAARADADRAAEHFAKRARELRRGAK